LKKEVFEQIKKELIYIGILFLIIIIIFKIIFFKESIANVLRTVLSLFWLFALPGYFLMLYWREKLQFAERFVIGTALALAINGILSYYFGLIGLNISLHIFLLPVILILIGIIINSRK